MPRCHSRFSTSSRLGAPAPIRVGSSYVVSGGTAQIGKLLILRKPEIAYFG